MIKEIKDAFLSKKIIVNPGEYAVTNQPAIIQTILGSCIAVCLYDKENKVAGMNHFLLASHRYARTMPMPITDAGRYGIHAMELLINSMLKRSAERKNFNAKVFGGAAVINLDTKDNFLNIGDVNIRFILDFLNREKISIDAIDVGGKQGRVIKFHTDTFRVYRRLIKNTSTEKIEKEEHKYWKKTIQTKEHEAGEIILFDE